MVNWENINTVFLDMDGTLLDLQFDNNFWLNFVPLAFSRKEKISLDKAKEICTQKFKKISGTLNWYSIDYWTSELNIDIDKLQESQSSKISMLPDVKLFLDLLKSANKKRILVTNAHKKSISLKMKKTKLNEKLDLLISSHDIGFAKEQSDFWKVFYQLEPYDKDKVLFIDDNLEVLSAAKKQGINNLLAISRPDLSKPVKNIENFKSIIEFSELIPSLKNFISAN